MADVSTWSATAASNNATPPDGWPENMLPSQVNDTGREMMAAIRRFYDDVVAQLVNGSVKAESGGGLGGYFIDDIRIITADSGGGLYIGDAAQWDDILIGPPNGNVAINSTCTFRYAQTTVNNLPAAGAQRIGQMMTVTNANAPAWGVAVAGGGAFVVNVLCNGSDWVVT